MSSFDQQFDRAMAAAGKKPARTASPILTLRKLSPGARHGQFVAVEDGWLVAYNINTNDFGCQTIFRERTKVRFASTGYDAAMFPAKADRDMRGFYFLLGSGPGAKRQIYIQNSEFMPATMEKSAIPEKDLLDREGSMRWVVIKEEVRKRGGRVHTVSLDRGRATKEILAMFDIMAKEIVAGKSEEEVTDLLYAKYGVDKTNEFIRHARYNWLNPRSPHDIVAFETWAGKKVLPLAIVGNLPKIDWCGSPGR